MLLSAMHSQPAGTQGPLLLSAVTLLKILALGIAPDLQMIIFMFKWIIGCKYIAL